MKKRSIELVLLSLFTFTLLGCAKRENITYNPDDFINPNRVVVKKVKEPIPTPRVHATFGRGNDPEVVKAYHDFIEKGVANNIESEGFETLAYTPYSHPIIACAPMHLCVVQLEENEIINNIELGDSAHWLVSTARVGSQASGSYQVTLKPKLYDLATDLVITTDKRTYELGLVSKKGAATHLVNFYYPEETVQQAQQLSERSSEQEQIVGSALSLDQLHFNYILHGQSPPWKPKRVFDDGTKTFIQMPPISERMDLPVLYLVKNEKMELVNYRYQRPYYIIDGLFKKAYLVSGKGLEQVRVEIVNRNWG